MDFIGPLAIRGWASSAIDFPRIVLVTVTSGTRLISVTLCPATAFIVVTSLNSNTATTFASSYPWVMAIAFTTVGSITGERM